MGAAVSLEVPFSLLGQFPEVLDFGSRQETDPSLVQGAIFGGVRNLVGPGVSRRWRWQGRQVRVAAIAPLHSISKSPMQRPPKYRSTKASLNNFAEKSEG